ncbi:MAG: hypothetical protein AAGG65_15270 [Pseudomonadota bacterium]
MATAHTLSQSTRIAHTLGHGIAQLFRGVVDFFALMNRATVAVAEYDRLSQLPDEKLAARGLKRSDIGRVVLERL